MRMWNVDPKLMCRKHLLGEHVEMHMFAGAIRLGTSISGYLAGGLVEPHRIYERHAALVAEMKSRGMKHRSPLRKFTWRGDRGEVDQAANRKELARRCAECRQLQSKGGK